MNVDTTELRRLLADYQATPSEAFWDSHVARRALIATLLPALPELLAELDRMRPYAVRGGYGADEKDLSEC